MKADGTKGHQSPHRQTSAEPMALPFGWNAGLEAKVFEGFDIFSDVAKLPGNQRMDKPSKGTCSRVKD